MLLMNKLNQVNRRHGIHHCKYSEIFTKHEQICNSDSLFTQDGDSNILEDGNVENIVA